MTNEEQRELLWLAAKAMGAELEQYGGQLYHKGQYCADSWSTVEYYRRAKIWNPLIDDGDALRVAVKLGISFSDDYTYPEGEWCIRVGFVFGNTLYGDQEICGDDPYAATRLAIVRAAAEIGRRMK